MRPTRCKPSGAVGLAFVLALNSVGCGGGGGDHGGSSTPGNPSFKTVVVKGKVALPGGLAIPAGTRVETALGSSPVATDGTFQTTVADALPSLVTVTSGDTTLMMGMFGKDRPTLDAKSEALAFVLLRTGVGALPSDVLKPILAEGGESVAVTNLAQTFESLGATHPGLAALTQASATAIVAASTAFIGGSRGVSIDPGGAQSGITVLQTTLNSVAVRNAYRRRALVWIDRVGYKPDQDGAAEVPSPAEISSFLVSPTTGVTSVVGGYLSAFEGTVAYAPTVSEETSLPLTPGNARSTHYQVTVAGAGASAGTEANLSADRKEAAATLAKESFFVDLLVPAVTNLLIGGAQLSPSGKQYAEELAILRPMIASLSAAPGLLNQISSGHFAAAMVIAFNFVATDSTAQAAFASALGQIAVYLTKKEAGAAFAAKLAKILPLLGGPDLVLAAGDLTAVSKDYSSSARADEFTVSANGGKVKLTPSHAETNFTSNVPLVASIPDAAAGATGITYSWKIIGVGMLRNGTQLGMSFETPNASLTFVPPSGGAGTATIEVDAVKKNADGSVVGFGRAVSVVEVNGGTVTLLPRRQSVKPNGTISFSAKVGGDEVVSSYLYAFSATGGHGTLDNDGKLLSSPSATYHAGSATGTDTITVTAYRLVQGIAVKFATASGEARVENEPTIIPGMLRINNEVEGDRRWVGAEVFFSPVDGAKAYVLHGYGSFDRDYYGSEINGTFQSPVFGGGTTAHPHANTIGLAGGVGPADGGDGGAASAGYYQNRFGGFTFELEVVK